MIKNYELTCLISVKTDEAEREEAIKHIGKAIEENGGQNTEIGPTSEIPLGYPIKKQEKAWLVVFSFQHEKLELDKLKKEIESDQRIIRCFLQKTPSKKAIPLSKREIKKEKKVELKDIDKKIEEIFNPTHPANPPKEESPDGISEANF